LVVVRVLLETDPEVQQATMIRPAELARDQGFSPNRITEAVSSLVQRGIFVRQGPLKHFYAINPDTQAWIGRRSKVALSSSPSHTTQTQN